MVDSSKLRYAEPKNAEALKSNLMTQLRQYSNAENDQALRALTLEAQEILFKGIELEGDLTRHRTKFISYVTNVLEKAGNYQDIKQPGAFKSVLGEEGLKLYKLALQEEVTDVNYRKACLTESVVFVAGNTFEKPPAIIISGPSGCGKSHASNRVLEKLEDLPKKVSGDAQGNMILRLDGAIFRETSQMRKLAIRAANELGYAGIKDLHDISSPIIEPMREKFRQIVINQPDIGVIIPETYSDWVLPFKSRKHEEFMTLLAKDRTLVFSQVVGVNDNFQQVVKFMGINRAYKYDDSEVVIDLNAMTNLKESKAYGETGFHFGVVGSKLAFDFYSAKFLDNALTIKIPNDLILVAKNSQTGAWESVNSEEKNARIVSKQAFEAWKKSDQSLDLVEFIKKNPIQPELEVSKALQQLLSGAPVAGNAAEAPVNATLIYKEQMQSLREASVDKAEKKNTEEEVQASLFTPNG